MRKKKLAVIITHPIQYYAPVFQLLTEKGNIDLKVFYTWGEDSIAKFDPGFGKKIEWDIPLLEGYSYEFLKNTSPQPGSHHFKGIENPDALKRIEEYIPDALLVYGWSYRSHLKILRYFKGKVPVIFRGDSNLIDEAAGWKSILKKILLSWVYKHVDKALFVGSANKTYYLKYGLREEQLIFAPHAIDNSRFSASRETEALELREKLGVEADGLLILFAGKLEPKKNPELLLEAFSQLRLNHVHLLFVGNGISERNLKSKVEGNNIPKVYFMDFQNQQMMPVIYQACNLFCLPSSGPGETWGLAVNEAMASGKPVLVSDKVGCSADLIKNNGDIFRSGDVADLKAKLQILLSDKLSLEKLGLTSKAIIANWTFNEQVNTIEGILQQNAK